jgi:hypothetical protein
MKKGIIIEIRIIIIPAKAGIHAFEAETLGQRD